MPVWPGFEPGAVSRVVMLNLIIKQREARRNLCRKLITKIQNNCGSDHDLTDTILQEIERQIALIQKLDQKYLEECGEEDLSKDIAIASEFRIEVSLVIGDMMWTCISCVCYFRGNNNEYERDSAGLLSFKSIWPKKSWSLNLCEKMHYDFSIFFAAQHLLQLPIQLQSKLSVMRTRLRIFCLSKNILPKTINLPLICDFSY